MPKAAKSKPAPSASTADSKTPTMGTSPAALAKRNLAKNVPWCHVDQTEVDPFCDPENPKAITSKDILKAASEIRKVISPTLLLKSRSSEKLNIELYFKVEIFHQSGSFHDRAAYNVVNNLTKEQKDNGLITTSLGNWGLALAYHCHLKNIKLMIVFPEKTPPNIINQSKERGAKIHLHGEDFAEAKHQAFVLSHEMEYVYINGYDHPDVIAGSGSVGVEIINQLPQVDAILVPIGGGGLLAGIAEYAKHTKPEILIYGVEPSKGCCFFKAMQNNRPFQSAVTTPCVAEKLLIPLAGCNAFYTAKSSINKMVLVDDDWINRAILELVEQESLVVEGAGATSFSALLAVPTVLPELRGKTVVCVLTGGNLDASILPRCLQRGSAVEGRLIKFKVKIPYGEKMSTEQMRIYQVIASTGSNVVDAFLGPAWISADLVHYSWLHLKVQAENLDEATSLKRVITQFFPDVCQFVEEPFSPLPICACYPKKRFQQ